MNANSASLNGATITRIVSLRLAVGLLGERDAAEWWTSGFMSQTSKAFLAPAFGSKVLQAQYQGILEAARRLHDERIGVGRVFHPFRLPEVIEQRLFEAVQLAGQEVADSVNSTEAANATLEMLLGKVIEARPGPALVGPASMLDEPMWVAEVASLYSAAFTAGVQSFPYFAGAR